MVIWSLLSRSQSWSHARRVPESRLWEALYTRPGCDTLSKAPATSTAMTGVEPSLADVVCQRWLRRFKMSWVLIPRRKPYWLFDRIEFFSRKLVTVRLITVSITFERIGSREIRRQFLTLDLDFFLKLGRQRLFSKNLADSPAEMRW